MKALTMARFLPLVAALLMTSLAAPAFAADRHDRDRHRPRPHATYAPGYSYYAPPTVVYAPPPPPPVVVAPLLSLFHSASDSLVHAVSARP